MSGEDPTQARVSTTAGTWSVVAAVSFPIVAVAIASIGFFVGISEGRLDNSDPRYAVPQLVGNRVAVVVSTTIAIIAVILGVASVVRAWPYKGRPGRKKALVRGWLGIGLAFLGVLFVAGFMGTSFIELPA